MSEPVRHKMVSPVVIWGIISGLMLNTVGMTTYVVRQEGRITVNMTEIEHVRELQNQQNENVEKALEDQKQDIKDIKDDVKELLRELRNQN